MKGKKGKNKIIASNCFELSLTKAEAEKIISGTYTEQYDSAEKRTSIKFTNFLLDILHYPADELCCIYAAENPPRVSIQQDVLIRVIEEKEYQHKQDDHEFIIHITDK